MTATAERTRRWDILRRLRPAGRTATPEPAPDLTPAGAAVIDSHVYASAAYEPDPGQTTTALGHHPAPEPAVENTGERTGIIVRFDADPGEQAATIPPLADGAELLPAVIFDALAAGGLPVWHGGPTTDTVDHSGELLVWETAGAS